MDIHLLVAIPIAVLIVAGLIDIFQWITGRRQSRRPSWSYRDDNPYTTERYFPDDE